jgi:ABC-type lipoprotein export system ATPase subunit
MDVSGGPIVAIEGLSRRFRRGAESVVALDDVSLVLYPGELTVAAGPSGSGKTTLLMILAGLDRADTGSLVTHPPLPDRTPTDRLLWRHLAFVPQAMALLDELTVRENIDLPARLDPSAAPPATRWSTPRILDLLDLGHVADRYPATISGGEQQRAALGRALRLRPPLLLGDEPTGHQDRERVELVLGILREYAYAGHTVLISSHDEKVIANADRIVTLADGRVVGDRQTAAGRY